MSFRLWLCGIGLTVALLGAACQSDSEDAVSPSNRAAPDQLDDTADGGEPGGDDPPLDGVLVDDADPSALQVEWALPRNGSVDESSGEVAARVSWTGTTTIVVVGVWSLQYGQQRAAVGLPAFSLEPGVETIVSSQLEEQLALDGKAAAPGHAALLLRADVPETLWLEGESGESGPSIATIQASAEPLRFWQSSGVLMVTTSEVLRQVHREGKWLDVYGETTDADTLQAISQGTATSIEEWTPPSSAAEELMKQLADQQKGGQP